MFMDFCVSCNLTKLTTIILLLLGEYAIRRPVYRQFGNQADGDHN